MIIITGEQEEEHQAVVNIKISIIFVLAGVTMLGDQKIHWLYKAEMSKLEVEDVPTHSKGMD